MIISLGYRIKSIIATQFRRWATERLKEYMIRSLVKRLNQINREEFLIKQMAEEQGIKEQLKAENQMLWVGIMNNIRSSAEEIVLNELVYR